MKENFLDGFKKLKVEDKLTLTLTIGIILGFMLHTSITFAYTNDAVFMMQSEVIALALSMFLVVYAYYLRRKNEL